MAAMDLDPDDMMDLDRIAELPRDRPAEAAVAQTFRPSDKHPTPFRPGRFGNGQWPVLYTSFERVTSEQEMRHYVGIDQFQQDGVETVWDVLEIQFDGSGHDLRPLVATVAALTDPNPSSWPQCHQYAAAAREAGVHGLISKSARRPGGDTLPVLSQAATSGPRRIGQTAYRYDEGTNSASITRQTTR
jgi:hypothetical protein